MTVGSQLAQTRRVETPDGRHLRVELAGDLRQVVVVQVGSPNAGVLYERWVEDAAARGLTLVSYDRPGYGGSSSHPGRSVADCVSDVRSISEALGFEQCLVWGFSGGGPHALACAALLADVVVAAATIGSPAPLGFDYFASRSDEARRDYEMFLTDRAAWDRENLEQREHELALSLKEFAEHWSEGKSACDTTALHGDFGAWLYRAVQTGLVPGDEGWSEDDIAIFRSPWGFDPSSISIPVKVWHGLDDHFVPVEEGRWLAKNIPAAQAELRNGDGHLNVVAERIGDVHDWLAQQGWSRRPGSSQLPSAGGAQ